MKPNGKPSGKQESGQAENKKQIYEGEHAERNRNLAEAENNTNCPGGNSETDRKRPAYNNPGNTEEPKVKIYRLTLKGPDKYNVYDNVRQDKTQKQAYDTDACEICMKDLKKHTGRPPGAERQGRASAPGRAPDS